MWFVIGAVAVVGAVVAWRKAPRNSGAPRAHDARGGQHGHHPDAHSHAALRQGQNMPY